MEATDANYIKGFNYGYALAKHAPEKLTELLPEGRPENEMVKGMKAGQQEYEKERALEQWKSDKQKMKKRKGMGD